jgi:MoaA/NifB/PqqE/SkfB family radical SAM enzyme
MHTDEFGALWPSMTALRPEKVVFTGGEPLLRPDILELLRGLRDVDAEHNVLRCLNSNGHLVTPNVARSLVGLVDEVRVSLDAMRQRNDALRGSGNFDAAVRALEIYHDAGFEPKVLVTISSLCLPDLEELISFLIEKKITRINLNVLRPIGRGSGYAEWQVQTQEVVAAVRRARQPCQLDRTSPLEVPAAECQSHCGVGKFLNIMPNGDVFPCHVSTNREFCCGNVRKESLVEICSRASLLGRLERLDFRQLAQQDERLAALAKAGTCMGTVYGETKSLPVWSSNLPLLDSAAGCGIRAPNQLRE